MAGSEKILVKTQAGLETVRGTGVAATRRVYGQTNLKRTANVVRREEDGTFSPIIGEAAVYSGQITASGTHSSVATFEDLAWWLQLGLKGGVVGVQAGVDPAYDYSFTPSQNADDLKSAVFEQSSNSTEDQWAMAYGMVKDFNIDIKAGASWMFNANLMGKDMLSQAPTAAIADRATESIKSKFTTVYIDAAGTGNPTTALTGTLYEASIHVDNGLQGKWFIGGADTLQGMGRGPRNITAKFVLELTPAAFTEWSNYQALAGRAVRFSATGAALGATTKKADIFLNGIWSSSEIGNVGTNRTLSFEMFGVYNLATAYEVKAVVRNGLVTLP